MECVLGASLLAPYLSTCYSICLECLTSIFQTLPRCLNPSDPFLDLTDIIISYADGSSGKESTCKAKHAGDPGSIPGLGRSPGEGNGNPLQDYCLENPMDRGAWWAAVHGVAKSRTRLSDFTSLLHTDLSRLKQRWPSSFLKSTKI